MLGRIIQRILSNLGSNEQLIDKLAETKPVRRAAQLTAYFLVRIMDAAKKQMIEMGKAEEMKKISTQFRKTSTGIGQTSASKRPIDKKPPEKG